MSGWPQSDVRKLSEEAQALVCRMLDQGELPNEIRRAVERLTGEKVMLHALSVFAEHYTRKSEDHKKARKDTDTFVRLAGKKGVKVSELIRAILVETLVVTRRKKQFTKADVFKLDDAERKRRELELKLKQERKAARREKKELEMKERQVRLAEEKLQLVREQMGEAIKKLDRKTQRGELVSTEDVRRIREIFGLGDDEPEEE